MTSRCRSVKADRHRSRQRWRPAHPRARRACDQRVSDIVEVKGGIAVVPAEHLERRQVGFVCVLGEVGEADLPLVALAVVGDKKEVIRLPGCAVSAVG